jgi:hypothetical protein
MDKHRFTALLVAATAATGAAAQTPSLASYSQAQGLLGSVPQAPDNQNFSTYDLGQIIAGHLLMTSSSSAAGTANGWTSAAPGLLKARNDLQVTASDGATVLERNYAGVVDLLHVTSATLPVGTPVDLSMNLAFNITYTSNGLTNNMPVGVNATFSANDGSHSAALHTDGPTQANGWWGSGGDVVSTVFTTRVGADVALDQRLAIDGQVSFVSGYGQHLTLDASHTALYFVDAPAGVFLTSATGHNYNSNAAAVPEPASTTLLLAGMLWLKFRRKAVA